MRFPARGSRSWKNFRDFRPRYCAHSSRRASLRTPSCFHGVRILPPFCPRKIYYRFEFENQHQWGHCERIYTAYFLKHLRKRKSSTRRVCKLCQRISRLMSRNLNDIPSWVETISSLLEQLIQFNSNFSHLLAVVKGLVIILNHALLLSRSLKIAGLFCNFSVLRWQFKD